MTTMTKKCSRCERILPVGEFYKRADRKAPFNTTSKCKKCVSEYQREYKARQEVRDGARKSRAGWQRKRMEMERNTISDTYVKKLLTQKTNLTYSQIPASLVEVMRAHIYLKRFLKDAK